MDYHYWSFQVIGAKVCDVSALFLCLINFWNQASGFTGQSSKLQKSKTMWKWFTLNCCQSYRMRFKEIGMYIYWLIREYGKNPNKCGIMIFTNWIQNKCGMIYANWIQNKCGTIYANWIQNRCGMIYANCCQTYRMRFFSRLLPKVSDEIL
jgi:hypothetical protein